jgi:UDP-N-acetylglucosamine 2-epimerase (non-hydrolysing)
MRVVCVAGARPNYIKVKPVLDALVHRGVEAVLVHTGQHYDDAMSDVFFADLDLPKPDHFLGVGSGTHAEQTARVMTAFEPLLASAPANAVVVVGDVNSTVACALVAAKAGTLVAHVEAGLRSRDWSMPEEVNRVVTDRVSDLLLAPSPDAVDNLQAEGYRADQIHLVGNTMIDTLLAHLDAARSRPVAERLGLAGAPYGVVTLHRPSNVDDPAVRASLLGALAEIGRQLPLVFPAHPRVRPHVAGLGEGVVVTEPLGYLDFLALEAGAALVLTDSGGVQEETSALGVPCLTLRETTERPVTVSEGTNTVVGVDPARIVAEARHALASSGPRPKLALWDGRAGERVADVLVSALAVPPGERKRPTDL